MNLMCTSVSNARHSVSNYLYVSLVHEVIAGTPFHQFPLPPRFNHRLDIPLFFWKLLYRVLHNRTISTCFFCASLILISVPRRSTQCFLHQVLDSHRHADTIIGEGRQRVGVDFDRPIVIRRPVTLILPRCQSQFVSTCSQ